MNVRRQPTNRQMEVLRAYIGAGSVAVAAFELGISETTVRQHEQERRDLAGPAVVGTTYSDGSGA